MIEVDIDRVDLRSWLVCETDQRWVTAVRRFAPELMPPPLVPTIVRADAQATVARAATLREQPAIVLWESRGETLLPVCDQLIQVARMNPRLLQLVAAPYRSAAECEILLELPCTAIVRHPEDLAGLRSLVRSYFRPPASLSASRISGPIPGPSLLPRRQS